MVDQHMILQQSNKSQRFS